MKRVSLILVTMFAVLVLLGGPANAQNVSPVTSPGGINKAAGPAPQVATDTLDVILDAFGFTYVVVARGNGLQDGVLLIPGGAPGNWYVLGYVGATNFELHNVNPAPLPGSGNCGSFWYAGTRAGAALTGRARNEVTPYNTGEGCVFDAMGIPAMIVFSVP